MKPDRTLLGILTINFGLPALFASASILVTDDFNAAGPDASKFTWGGQVGQNGGTLILSTGTGVTSWIRSIAGSTVVAGDTLTLQFRTYTYSEDWDPGIYGDAQPRGLRVGSDGNNAIEFFSVSRTIVGMRASNAGSASSASYTLPSGTVNIQRDYQITVTTTGAVFSVDGALAGILTNNLPAGTLNAYLDTYYAFSGNVPVSLDSLTLSLATNQVAGTAPDITEAPTNATVAARANVTFNVTATGTGPLSYQWRKEDTNLVGATNTVLTLNNVQTNQAGSYTVVVTNNYGSVTSSVAILTVTNSPYSPATDFYYSTSAGAVTITGYKGNGGVVNIPNSINGFPVVAIQFSAFEGSFNIYSVTIPDSVTTIGFLAFSDVFGLTNVVIGNGVTNIGNSAFSANSDLKTVVLGTNITTIASGAFNSCPGLTTITTIPRSVTSIAPSAFITSSTCLPALNVDPLNPAYASSDGVLFDKGLTTLMACPGAKSGNYLIPTSVTTVSLGAFYYCQFLTGVTIPASVTNLGSSAFLNCSSLASITLPSSIETIGDKTFFNCTSLTSVSIPNSVTTIGFEAFRNCSSLENISIPSGVTTIADEAFIGCSSMRCAAFQGNAPTLGGGNVFLSAANATVYYLPATMGWGSTYGGRPTATYLTVPFSENFEAGLPGGWTQDYVTGTTAWISKKGGNGSPQNTHPGGGGVLNALLFGSGVATKLVTPMLDLGSATAARLTFWLDMKIRYGQDQMRVYYKTSPLGSWMLLQSYSYCSSWTQFALDLPTPSRTYYIAFEAIGNNGYGVCLDDVTVTATAFPLPPSISNSGLPSGVAGTDYSQTLSASGGAAPYTWSLAAGALPPGLSLSGSGVISGNPSSAVNTGFVVRVNGADGLSSTNTLGLTINPAPTLSDPLYVFTNFVGDPALSGAVDGTNKTALFLTPVGICVDSAGNLFVSDNDNHMVRKVTPAGVVTVLAGLAGTPGTNDGVGNTARFYNPAGTAVDTGGLVYVADQNNNTIRTILPNGTVTTVAGTPGMSGIDVNDTNNWYRYLNSPGGVTVGNGYVYIADTGISMIAKVMTPYPDILPVAGFAEGSADGAGLQAQFRWPEGIALNNGVLYVTDTGNQTIRKVTTDRSVTTIAGSPGLNGSSDGVGSFARFNFPVAVTVDANRNLFVADRGNHTIRKITPAGVVTTIGGLAGVPGSADEAGNAARFNSPSGVAVDANGVLYIADKGNHRVSKGIPIYPAVVTATTTGLQLNLSWPANYLGWELQVQTNNLSTNWSSVIGSTSANQMSLTLDKNCSAMFFRLHKP